MSSTIRSSVRPKSSKQPWGTILQPSFGMGYQKLTEYEIEQTVSRLHTIKRERQRHYTPPPTRPMSAAQIDSMV